MVLLSVTSLGVVSLRLMCVYIREASLNCDMVLDDEFVLCIPEKLPMAWH